MASELHIDVYVDLICPWCLIGKSHLDLALAQLAQEAPKVEVSLQWHSVQLIADVPADGLDYAEFYLRRLGSPEAVRARQGQVREAAQAAGVVVDFGRIKRFPNSLRAHQLLAFAARHLTADQLEAMLDRLFAAYFNRGEDLGDMATLRAVAMEWGLDVSALQTWIDAGQGLPKPVRVPGVPFFVFNRVQTLSGAQPPSTLLAVMQSARSSASPA